MHARSVSQEYQDIPKDQKMLMLTSEMDIENIDETLKLVAYCTDNSTSSFNCIKITEHSNYSIIKRPGTKSLW